MLVDVIKSFSYAYDGGVRVRRYVPGVQILDEEVAATAIREGWARQKMRPEAPANKMATVEATKAVGLRPPRSTLSLRRSKKKK